jgi:hypothetical protein
MTTKQPAPRSVAKARGGREAEAVSRRQQLLLPGALLVTIQAQLLAALVLVNFRLAAFFD